MVRVSLVPVLNFDDGVGEGEREIKGDGRFSPSFLLIVKIIGDSLIVALDCLQMMMDRHEKLDF